MFIVYDISADIVEDFTSSSLSLSFAPCEARACSLLPIINDDVIERNKSFQFMMERTPQLQERIKLKNSTGTFILLDDNGMYTPNISFRLIIKIFVLVMVVGFSSATFTTTETTGYANVCVAVTNPPSGGAIRLFTVTILPGEGMV